MCPHTTTHYMCPDTCIHGELDCGIIYVSICVLILLYTCRHITMYVFSYDCGITLCVLILLYMWHLCMCHLCMCPHTTIMCPHTTIHACGIIYEVFVRVCKCWRERERGLAHVCPPHILILLYMYALFYYYMCVGGAPHCLRRHRRCHKMFWKLLMA